jgi:hypothetical protein
MSYRDPTQVIVAIDPVVVATETRIHEGQWHASGHVQIEFKRGPKEGFAKLEFPFANASSPNDAMQQVRPMLEQFAAELGRLIESLQGELPPQAATEQNPLAPSR